MRFALNQTITYWGPRIGDQFGGLTYSAPIQLKARWQDESDNMISSKGQEMVSKAVIYCDKPLESTGYLLLGESEEPDPTTVEHAQEIRNTASTPNLRSLKTLYRAYI